MPEHTNDTWVKVYLPLLKEMNDGYERLPGSGRIRKQMNHEIKHNGIPITMRGQAWPLLIGNKSRVTAHLFEFYKSMPEKTNQVGYSPRGQSHLIEADIPRTFPDLN